MRRAKILQDITLGEGGNSSGGYFANVEVDGTIHAGTQQQYFFRNTSMYNFEPGNWHFTFLGCEGAPDSQCNASAPPAYTTIDQTPLIAEKPYITIDSNDKYYLKRPLYKTATQGVDWDDDADVFDFSQVYVANDTNSAADINAKLSEGLHVVL